MYMYPLPPKPGPKLEAVELGLAEALLTKAVIEPYWYERLRKDSDGPAYVVLGPNGIAM